MKNSVKEARAKKNLTQQHLAELLKVSRQTINSIEANRYVPSTTLALKLSQVFKVPVNQLFELDEND